MQQLILIVAWLRYLNHSRLLRCILAVALRYSIIHVFINLTAWGYIPTLSYHMHALTSHELYLRGDLKACC